MNDDAENRGNRTAQDAGGESKPLDGEEIIDLTEAAEDESAGPQESGIFDESEDGILSLDEAALEEEEIVDLVDVAEEEGAEVEEAPLDLSDLVEEELSEGDGDDASNESDSVFSDEDSEEKEFAVDMGDDLTATAVDMTDLSDDQDASSLSLELEDEVVETSDEGDLPAGGDEEAVADRADDEALVARQLSEEKLEAIVTRVVKETIEEKAGPILLEVAESAIAKEIEKIKKAL